ncbi:hypothetical protein DSM25558_4686 [Agrobacterium sp. DSM 25558]|nr:hypothetical protein DSM25558_4686 [Agrobacterium sp. DSM 25558]
MDRGANCRTKSRMTLLELLMIHVARSLAGGLLGLAVVVRLTPDLTAR